MTTTFLAQILAAAVAGLSAMVFMVVHPAGPALVMALINPFDALFNGLFGLLGNTATYLPILALAFVSPPSIWVHQYFGTRVQMAFFILILMLTISHFQLVQVAGLGGVLEFLRKLTLLPIMAVWAWGMRTGRHLGQINKVLVISSAAYTLLSMLDFYGGINLLPGAEATYTGLEGTQLESYVEHAVRYRGGGLPVNRTANWLIIPTFIGMGWFMMKTTGREKGFAFACTAICAFGIAATISRSAITGAAIGVLILLPTVFRLNLTQIVGVALAGLTLVGLSYLLLSEAGFMGVFQARFASEEGTGGGGVIGRLALFGKIFRLFASAPFFGIGDNLTAYHPLGQGLGAHNLFLGILTEAGLFGFVPFIAFLAIVTLRLAKKVDSEDPAYEQWRPFFFAGFVATIFMNNFNEYTWEHILYYAMAFAVAIERASTIAQTKRARAAFGFDAEPASEPITEEAAGPLLRPT